MNMNKINGLQIKSPLDGLLGRFNDSIFFIYDSENSTAANPVKPSGCELEKDVVVGTKTLLMLGIFAATGTIGNILVLYGFSNMLRQNLTSTIFILTIAGADLLTSTLIIPSTIYIEIVQYRVHSDFLCKFYHFLLASTVPYSMFLMVAIAVDRYFCICRPFLHYMNMSRARKSVLILSVCAGGLGVIASLFYQQCPIPSCEQNISDHLFNDTAKFFIYNNSNVMWYNLSFSSQHHVALLQKDVKLNYIENVSNTHAFNRSLNNSTCALNENDFKCVRNFNILGKNFYVYFQRLHLSLFMVGVIIVSHLYVLIYISVMKRRRKTRKLRSTRNIHTDNSLPQLTTTLNEQNGDNRNPHPEVTVSPLRALYRTLSSRRSNRRNKHKTASRRSERAFLLNLRTALTLFVVTLMFIVVILPSWLMALKVLKLNVTVFYLYFLHAVINPLIYAFMNGTFRQTVRYMGHCNSSQQGAVTDIAGVSHTT